MKNFKWDKKYLYWGVTAFCVIVCSIAFFWVLNKWSGVYHTLGLVLGALSPFIYGILIAYLNNKVMMFFEKHLLSKLAKKMFPEKPVTARKAARIFSILVTVLLVLGVIVGILLIFLPQIYHSVVRLITESSRYITIAVAWVEKYMQGDKLEPVVVEWLNTAGEHLVAWLETDVLPQISTLISSITGGVISIVTVVVDFFIGLVISIYILYNKETFCAQVKKLLMGVFKPRMTYNLIREMNFINEAFGDYLVAEIIDSLIVGVVNYIFMVIVGMPYAALVSILMCLTNLIPIFGPFIGAIPSALLILLEDPMMCLVFIIFTLVLQQLDGHILKPKIHSTKSGISGFWIMFAILFFGGLFGIAGMILGVPITTVLYSIIRRLNNRHLRRRGLPEDTQFYKDVDYIDPETGKPVYKPGRSPEELLKQQTPPDTASSEYISDGDSNTEEK
ncbi:MAG: AI-2E family transporter [Oscillospiraceae bacterium]